MEWGKSEEEKKKKKTKHVQALKRPPLQEEANSNVASFMKTFVYYNFIEPQILNIMIHLYTLYMQTVDVKYLYCLEKNTYCIVMVPVECYCPLLTGGGQILRTHREVLPVADYIFAVKRCKYFPSISWENEP